MYNINPNQILTLIPVAFFLYTSILSSEEKQDSNEKIDSIKKVNGLRMDRKVLHGARNFTSHGAPRCGLARAT